MTEPSQQPTVIALLGLGLISGSLAGALRKSSWQGDIIGWGPRAPSLERGQALGLIDRFSLDLSETVSQADIVVIGAPPVATAQLLPEVIALALECGSPIITDLASIKGYVVSQALPHYPNFVPGHPIAGSENSGVDAARADLFEGREVILTPLDDTAPQALASIEAMWTLTGARVTHMSVSDHDAALAASSHVPHMVAYALTAMLGEDQLAPMKHGGGALRDMTRIAASDPVMWRDIALTNRESILTAMDAMAVQHDQLRTLIAEGDGESLEALFAQCRALRREHDAILNPMPDPDRGIS